MDEKTRDAHFDRANRLRSGRPDLAIREYRHALAADPEHAHSLAGLAIALEVTGDRRGAIDAARAAAARAPEDGFVQTTLSWVLSARGLHEEALTSARAAVRLAPSDPETHRFLSVALRRCGDPAAALVAADEALALAPRDLGALVERSNALRLLGRVAEARDAARTALSIDPDDFFVLRCAAEAAVADGDRDAAAEHYRAALRTRPGDPSSRTDLAKVLRERTGWVRAAVRASTWYFGLSWPARLGVATALVVGTCGYAALPAIVLVLQSFAGHARTIDPVADLALRFDSRGRFLLTAEQIVESDRTVTAILAVAGGVTALVAGTEISGVLAAVYACGAVPCLWIVPACGSAGRRAAMAAYAFGALGLAAAALWTQREPAPSVREDAAPPLLAIGVSVAAAFALARAPLVARRLGYPSSHRFDLTPGA